jgi:hypothetical protein
MNLLSKVETLLTGLCLVLSPIAASSAQVTVRPFHTGRCQLGKDHLLGGDHDRNERLPFMIYAFLVEGTHGEKALVDLGPKTIDYCNRMFVRYALFRDRGWTDK